MPTPIIGFVVDVLRHFGELAATAKRSVRTDIPLGRVPDLARLAAGMEPGLTLTQTFGREYIARRRAKDNFPVPAEARIRATVRELILYGRRPQAPRRELRAAC